MVPLLVLEAIHKKSVTFVTLSTVPTRPTSKAKIADEAVFALQECFKEYN